MTKEKAIKMSVEHWEDNLRRLDEVDWEMWIRRTPRERSSSMLMELLPVHISSDYCALCDKYFGAPDPCPLSPEDTPCTGDCCREWLHVYKSLKFSKSKKTVKQNMEKMLRRLRDVD